MAARSAVPDRPIAFGYKCAWYAIRTNNTDGVVAALGLTRVVDSGWQEGIEAAYRDRIFITPPLGEWTLTVGWLLNYSGDDPRTVVPVLTRLSGAFGEAQYFATHRVVEAHCWALAREDKFLRGYCFIGESGEVIWNEGEPTGAELALGKDALDFPGPNEQDVMAVAGAWSIDPSELEQRFTKPSMGRLGSVAKEPGRRSWRWPWR